MYFTFLLFLGQLESISNELKKITETLTNTATYIQMNLFLFIFLANKSYNPSSFWVHIFLRKKCEPKHSSLFFAGTAHAMHKRHLLQLTILIFISY